MNMNVEEERRKKLYAILFDEIKRINLRVDLDARDKSFLTESLKEQIGRIEHHELGPDCPCTDTDFIEVGYGKIVAYVLKCRSTGNLVRDFELKTHLDQSETMTKAKGYTIPLLIETVDIGNYNHLIGAFRDIEWANTGLKRTDVTKDEWKKLHYDIRNKEINNVLNIFFNRKAY